MIKPSMSQHGDKALPKADTCFFNLELPDYSTAAIMRERMLLAIHTDCDSMNAEQNHMNLAGGDIGAGGGDDEHSFEEDY